MPKVRKIDRKLKACHNPLLDPESDIFKQRAAAAQQQVKEDRDSKVDLQDVPLKLCNMQRCDECGMQQAAQNYHCNCSFSCMAWHPWLGWCS